MSDFEIFKKGIELLEEKDITIDEGESWRSGTILREEDYLGESFDPLSFEQLSILYNKNLEKFDESEREILKKFVDLHWNYEKVEHVGGESKGSVYYTVYYFPTANMYIRFDGHYQSYHGADYYSCKQVFPEQKTITVYE